MPWIPSSVTRRRNLLRVLGVLLGLAAIVLGQTADWLGPAGSERHASGQFLLTGLGTALILLSAVLSREFETLRRRYLGAALLVLNTLVLFLVVNTVFAAAFFVVDVRRTDVYPGPLEKYGIEVMQRVYGDSMAGQIEQLLAETYRPLSLQPHTLFRETPFSGRYVTVDPSGFRHVENQGPWPPDTGNVNVFVFGGSTTFGYGVADRETIPSYLQAALGRRGCTRPVRVYNFGRGFYYSTQERILFEQLVAEGLRPDLAIFVDGLNDSSREADVPDLFPELSALFDRQQAGGSRIADHLQLPLLRAARKLQREVAPEAQPAGGSAAGAPAVPYTERVLKRWQANRRLIETIGSGFGIPTTFVWQPIPIYKYDLSHHPFAPQVWEAEDVYRRVEEKVAAGEMPGVLWLGHIQESRAEPLYVDAVHYTAAFSREIAGRIADHVVGEGLVCAPAE